MEFDFTQTMQNETDENLIKIVTIDRDNYQPPAVIAAEAELKKRNIGKEIFEGIKKEHEETRKIEIEKASMPLDNTTKIVAFFIPIGYRFLARPLRRDGYEQKAADLVKWSLFGMAFYFLVIVILNSF